MHHLTCKNASADSHEQKITFAGKKASLGLIVKVPSAFGKRHKTSGKFYLSRRSRALKRETIKNMVAERDGLPPFDESVDQSSPTTTGTVKRRRSRAIVSCLYCRERRLKCNQARPKCNSCESRNLDACLYFEDTTPERIAVERAKIRSRKMKVTKNRKNLSTVPDNVMENSSFMNRILPPPSSSDSVQGHQSFANVPKDYSRDGNSLMVQAPTRNFDMQSSNIEPIIPKINSNNSSLHQRQSEYYRHKNQLLGNSKLTFNKLQSQHNPLQIRMAEKEIYSHSVNLFSNKPKPLSPGLSPPTSQSVPIVTDSLATTVHPNHSDNLAQDFSTTEAHLQAQNLASSGNTLSNSTFQTHFEPQIDQPTSFGNLGPTSNHNLPTETIAPDLPHENLDQMSSLKVNDHPDASRGFGVPHSANTSQHCTLKDTTLSCASGQDLGNTCGLEKSAGTSPSLAAPEREEKCSYVHPFTLGFAQSVEPVNPLRQYTIVLVTEKAACMVGATSVICLFKNSKCMEENKSIWDAFRVTCEQSSKGDPNGLDGVFKERHVLLRDRGSSLLQEIVATLPSYSSFKKTLFSYFQTAYHSLTNFIEEKAVVQLFEDLVEVDLETDRITSLNVDDRTNFFSVGVILLLYKIVKGHTVDHDCFTEFFCYIRGITSGLTFSLHRIQFLLLNYFQTQFDPLRGAHTRSVHLIAESLGSMTDMLGLRTGAQKYYKDKLEHVGLIHTLQNIWYWSLYADVLNSFENGKSLNVSYGSFDEEELNTLEAGRIGKLKRFLYLARKIIFDLNKPRGIPDIEGMLIQVDKYLNVELHSLETYCDAEHLEKVDLFDYVVLTPLIALKICLWYLQLKVFKADEVVHKNKLFRILVTSFKMITALSTHCSYLKSSSSGISSEWTVGESATNISFWLKKPLTFRALITLFDLMYERGKADRKVTRRNLKKRKNLIMENLVDFERPEAEVDYTNNQYSSSDMFIKYTELMNEYYSALKDHLEVKLEKPYGSYSFRAVELHIRSIFISAMENSANTNQGRLAEGKSDQAKNKNHSSSNNHYHDQNDNKKALNSRNEINDSQISQTDTNAERANNIYSYLDPPAAEQARQNNMWDYNPTANGVNETIPDQDLFSLDFDFSKFLSPLL